MAIPVSRPLDVDLAGVPKRWLAGSEVATALWNGLSLLLPDSERLFVRSLHRVLDRIDDPELRAQVRAFSKQEGHHASAHDDFNAALRAHGYSIDEFLARFRAVSRWIEARLPAELNVAGTAAAEHFTTALAAGAFAQGVFDEFDPRMRRAWAWHAAEELEHKTVAFDVLQTVSRSYGLRMAGLAYAMVMLGGFWSWATASLLRQDDIGWRGILRGMRALRTRDPIIRRVFLPAIRQYARRDFHPRDNTNEHLPAAWFAAHGMALPDAA